MKNKIVTIGKPANLEEVNASIFEPYLSYGVPTLKVIKLTGPFITETGIVSNAQRFGTRMLPLHNAQPITRSIK